jgi:peptidoglycan hydrolase-like protein with peptidoglycan-binding domain
MALSRYKPTKFNALIGDQAVSTTSTDRQGMGSHAGRAAVATTILCFLVSVLPIAAKADNLTPAYCRTFVQSYTASYEWKDTCWLGQNGTYYERNGMLTMGVQRWAHGVHSSINCSPHDGYFGPTTETCIRAWQDYAPDTPTHGLVKGQDWKVLESDRIHTSCDPTYCYYRTYRWGSAIARRWATNGYWYVLDGDASHYRAWDRNGPYT